MERNEIINYLARATEDSNFTVEIKNKETGMTGIANLMPDNRVSLYIDDESDPIISLDEFINNWNIVRIVDETNNTVQVLN